MQRRTSGSPSATVGVGGAWPVMVFSSSSRIDSPRARGKPHSETDVDSSAAGRSAGWQYHSARSTVRSLSSCELRMRSGNPASALARRVSRSGAREVAAGVRDVVTDIEVARRIHREAFDPRTDLAETLAGGGDHGPGSLGIPLSDPRTTEKTVGDKEIPIGIQCQSSKVRDLAGV